MRTIALSGTVCGLVLAITGVSVASDFDALLQDLSFGDAPKLNQPVSERQAASEEQPSSPIAAAVQQNPEMLKPAPGGFRMPASTGYRMPASPQVEVTTPNAPLVALQNPIETPDLQPVDEPAADVNFTEMFNDSAATDVALFPSTTKATTVSLHHNRCDAPASAGCDAVITCRPHLKPNLPSSTFLQYFRSNPCYTNVWDGYNQNCGSNHSHLHGTCDCFDPNKKKGFWGSRSDCGSCDGGCDR